MNCNVSRKYTKLASVLVCDVALSRTYLLPYLGHGGRHKCGKQRCGNSDSFKEIVKNSCKSGLVGLVLCKHPRSSLVNVLVCTGNYLEYLSKSDVQGGVVHALVNLCTESCCHGGKLIVHRVGLLVGRKSAAEILLHHCNGSGNKVAQVICKVGVNSVYHYLVGE